MECHKEAIAQGVRPAAASGLFHSSPCISSRPDHHGRNTDIDKINLTGSVWFFLLIGQAELSLTVPIVNSLAFLFTVLGDWVVDRKVITWGAYFPFLHMPSTNGACRYLAWYGACLWRDCLVCS